MYHEAGSLILLYSARCIMTAEQSPFHNPVAARAAGDAGWGMSREEFDPDGVAQRQVDKLN